MYVDMLAHAALEYYFVRLCYASSVRLNKHIIMFMYVRVYVHMCLRAEFRSVFVYKCEVNVYMCAWVCVCDTLTQMHTHTYKYAHTYVQICTHTQTHTHTRAHTRMHANANAYAYTYAIKYSCINTHISTYVDTHTYIHLLYTCTQKHSETQLANTYARTRVQI